MANKMEILGKLMMEAANNPKIMGLLGELLVELQDEKSVEDIQQVAGCIYVLGVEATNKDGSKVVHPILTNVNGYGYARCIQDIGMLRENTLIAAQRMADRYTAISGMGLKLRVIQVTEEAYDKLTEKMTKLLSDLEDAIDEAAQAQGKAYDVMNADIDVNSISEQMLSDILRKTLYAGACVDDNGEVVDRQEETYEEERRIGRRSSKEEPEEDERDCCGDCSDCDDEYCEDRDEDYCCGDCDCCYVEDCDNRN